MNFMPKNAKGEVASPQSYYVCLLHTNTELAGRKDDIESMWCSAVPVLARLVVQYNCPFIFLSSFLLSYPV